MRVWVVTALNKDGHFIDQRRIEAPSQSLGEKFAYDWIRRVGGDLYTSKIQEV